MSKNDIKKSFFAKYSIERSFVFLRLHAEGVSNLKLATAFIACNSYFRFSGKDKKKVLWIFFLSHYLALFYVSCKWDRQDDGSVVKSFEGSSRTHFRKRDKVSISERNEEGIIVKSLNYFSLQCEREVGNYQQHPHDNLPLLPHFPKPNSASKDLSYDFLNRRKIIAILKEINPSVSHLKWIIVGRSLKACSWRCLMKSRNRFHSIHTHFSSPCFMLLLCAIFKH